MASTKDDKPSLLRRIFRGSGAPPFATGRPQVRNSGIEREVYDAIMEANGIPQARPGRFRGWTAYKDRKKAAAAEAAAVAFVNEGVVDAPPLTDADLADSRKSAEWLSTHERKGLVEEGTLPHVGRPRFFSLNGFYDIGAREYQAPGFQGDRFSSTIPVDVDAYRKDPAAYEKSGRWAVIPTVYPDEDGKTRLHTGADADAAFRKSGKHFGIYEGVKNANLGAEWDHHTGNAEWAKETRQDAKGGDTRADSNGGNSFKTLLHKVFRGSGAPPFATGRPQVRNSGIEREVFDAIMANTPWKWETYRWNPEAIGGQAVDPKNIKGTGVAFDEADRATLPDDRRAAFEAWMDELADPKSEWETDDGRMVKVSSRLVPKDWRTNKKYDRDYDFVRAFLLAEQDPELKRHMLGPVYHEEEGKYWLHMNDLGKLPTHPVFSTDSYYAQDPKYAPLAGSWEGETYIPGKAERAVHQDAKGGDVGQETAVSETPVSEGGGPAPEGGPRIVINPTTFHNKKDALCVAFNEAFRIVMEDMQFDPVSEPTDRQRRFFSDTAYANDETQLRRTILARICTFDTSVKDPTDEQLEEAVEFLENVMEVGAPQNEWEQSAVQRIHDVVAQSIGRQPVEEPEPGAPSDEGTVEADIGGGDADSEDERRKRAVEFAEERGMDTTSMDEMPIEAAESVYKMHEEGQQTQDAPQGTAQADAEKDPQVKAWKEFAASYSRDQPATDTGQAAPAEQPAAEQGGFAVKSEKELSKMGVAERMDYNRQVRQETGMSAMQAAGSAGDGEDFAAKSEKELSKMGVAERMDYNRQVRQATGMSATQAARASVGAEEENPVHAKVPHHGAVLSKDMRRFRELTSRSQWEFGENGDA